MVYNSFLNSILKKAYSGRALLRGEIAEVLGDEGVNDELFHLADKVRKEFKGDGVHLRGLIEFTNFCRRNCLYCGLRAENKNIERFRLNEEKILKHAKKAVAEGYKTIVLQGGEDPYFTAEKLAPLVSKIKELGAALTLSVGEMTEGDYKILKNAGADRFLLRIETSDPNLYQKFHPNMSYENRVNCLKNLKKLGYETGTGVLTGLFGQDDYSLAGDILFFKELDADMVGLGPLIVNEDTPLKGQKNGDLIKAIKMIAITRLLMPDINIPATTAMETLHPKGRLMALQAGANVIMPNIGGDEKELYNIYPGKGNVNDRCDTSIQKIGKMLENIGRYPSGEYGFRGKI